MTFNQRSNIQPEVSKEIFIFLESETIGYVIPSTVNRRIFYTEKNIIPTKQQPDPSLLVLGILSADNKIHMRNAQRETWLSDGLIQYRFLVDRETDELRKENDTFGDIVFLNATFSGYATGYGEKLDLWLKYAWKHFPNVTLYGKCDDDVYVCSSQMQTELQSIAHGRLYYGWTHFHWLTAKNRLFVLLSGRPIPLADMSKSAYNYHDEMFVLVGRDLVRPIVSRPYCYPKGCVGKWDDTRTCKDPDKCISNKTNWDTNIADTSLAHWMNDTSGHDIDIVPANTKMLHYQERFYKKDQWFDVFKQDLCSSYLLKHGNVTPAEMKWIFNHTKSQKH